MFHELTVIIVAVGENALRVTVVLWRGWQGRSSSGKLARGCCKLGVSGVN